jgi:U4/U6.U5 tri-snRNP-associated protein 2
LVIGVNGPNFGKVFCLPDDYEVIDNSLNDIKYNVDPKYTPDHLSIFDKEVFLARSLEGTEFTPGMVGLNNLKLTSFANVIIQLLSTVRPVRDHYLLEQTLTEPAKDLKHLLSCKFGELIRKVWNPLNFKGHVSPAEFIEAVSLASSGKFKCDMKPTEY